MCLFLAVLGLHCCLGVSAVRRVGPSPVEVPGLPLWRPLPSQSMGEPGFNSRSSWTPPGHVSCISRALEPRSSIAAAHRSSCFGAHGTLLDQGSSLCPLHWQGILSHHGSLKVIFLKWDIFITNLF